LLDTWKMTPLVAPVIETEIGPVPPVVPLFRTVTFCAGPKLPPNAVKNTRFAGEAESRVPMPLSDTGEPATGTLAVMARLPAAAPGTVGRNATLTVHEAFAARVAAQFPPVREYGPVNVNVMPVAVAPPEFESVRV
jgi:hypothetical protein